MRHTRFSANLGFLWQDRALPDAIRAAAAAGFDAVECHWPHDVPPAQVRAALTETGLPMLGINTRRGRPGERGLAALPGRETEARAEIDATLDYARAIGAEAVHLMAGVAAGPAAEAAFRGNLAYACGAAPDLTLLIEPLNPLDAPGYFLAGSAQAEALIRDLGRPNLKLMFDCYHLQLMEGDVIGRLARLAPVLGHVQIAAVPDRGTPDHGDVDYRRVCAALRELNWDRPLGAEYLDPRPTAETLGWMAALRG